MKARLLRKISKRIRIVNKNNMFVVEIRNHYRNWHTLRDFKTLSDAQCQKRHYIKVVLIKDFGVMSRYKKKKYA